jgi:hypothetical protein
MVPLPVPRNVRGSVLNVLFVTDERGAIERMSFLAVGDDEFSRRVVNALRQTPMSAALRTDGTPVRGYGLLRFTF